jgi:hypothetical protein
MDAKPLKETVFAFNLIDLPPHETDVSALPIFSSNEVYPPPPNGQAKATIS